MQQNDRALADGSRQALEIAIACDMSADRGTVPVQLLAIVGESSAILLHPPPLSVGVFNRIGEGAPAKW